MRFCDLPGCQRMAKVPNIAEYFNRLSRAHERYRQTTDHRQTDRPQTDGRYHIATFAKNEKCDNAQLNVE